MRANKMTITELLYELMYLGFLNSDNVAQYRIKRQKTIVLEIVKRTNNSITKEQLEHILLYDL